MKLYTGVLIACVTLINASPTLENVLSRITNSIQGNTSLILEFYGWDHQESNAFMTSVNNEFNPVAREILESNTNAFKKLNQSHHSPKAFVGKTAIELSTQFQSIFLKHLNELPSDKQNLNKRSYEWGHERQAFHDVFKMTAEEIREFLKFRKNDQPYSKNHQDTLDGAEIPPKSHFAHDEFEAFLERIRPYMRNPKKWDKFKTEVFKKFDKNGNPMADEPFFERLLKLQEAGKSPGFLFKKTTRWRKFWQNQLLGKERSLLSDIDAYNLPEYLRKEVGERLKYIMAARTEASLVHNTPILYLSLIGASLVFLLTISELFVFFATDSLYNPFWFLLLLLLLLW